MSTPSGCPPAVTWQDGRLSIIDQRRLPDALVTLELTGVADVVDAIRTLAVRGAPAIGIAAAYGLAVSMAPHRQRPSADYLQRLAEYGDTIASARPTAVNLGWAVNRVRTAARSAASDGTDPHAALVAEAERIHAEDRAQCRAIAAAGRPLIEPGCGVLTHCNAGALAVSELGTATAPLYAAHADGVPLRAYACETRPLLQGARLTAWELSEAGIDVSLICDSMAATLMASGAVDLVIVGTDRVTANGDVVNKIGTLSHAIAAAHYGIPFYVACPASTFDAATPSGADVPIEMRAADEVRQVRGVPVAPPAVKVFNPAFDVTPAALVSGFITDRGLLAAPYPETLAAAFGT